MNLSANQIAQYAYNAGFRGQALITAIAVALAESNGNTQAYNPENAAGTPNGSGSRGLWQIYGKAHPQYNNDSVYDPQVNANAAYAVSNGGNFAPWSTFNGGQYKQYLNTAASAASSVNGTVIQGTTLAASDPCAWSKAYGSAAYTACQLAIGAGAAITPGGSTLAPGGGLNSAIGSVSSWLDPMRIIKVAIGVGMVLVALLLLVAPDAAKTAVKAAPVIGA